MPESSKIILLTGASSGIGAALARILARRGFRIAMTARSVDRLESLAEECRGLGADVAVFPADLAKTDEAGRLIGEVTSRFGGLDVLINNAGYGLGSQFVDAAPAEIVKQFDVNLVTPVLLAWHALPHLASRRGTIINVGSSLSTVALPLYGVYGTTKAAMAYWNDALRREVRKVGINVCLVEPGPVATEFFDNVKASGHVESSPFDAKPPAFFTATADEAARQIARLIDHPRRRISMLRRTVWPLRLFGGLFRVFPALGDLAFRGLAAKSVGRARD